MQYAAYVFFRTFFVLVLKWRKKIVVKFEKIMRVCKKKIFELLEHGFFLPLLSKFC